MRYKLSAPDQWLGLYGDILYRYGLARIRDTSVAEDLVQETLLAALKTQSNYAGLASEQTWLIGILKHKIIDFFRKSMREKRYESEAEDDDFFDQEGGWRIAHSTWSKPDQSMEQAQFLSILEKCIDHLPPRMAQLFILRELDGMRSEEICEVMSISTMNNLWVMLSRTRGQLRNCLGKNWANQ